MYRYLFFDADGTLFDFDQAEEKAFRLTSEHLDFSCEKTTNQCYKLCNERCWKEFEKGLISLDRLKTKRFEDFFSEINLKQDAAYASEVYQKYLSMQGILYSESIPLLQEMKTRGYHLYLASNGISQVQRGRLKHSNISNYFEEIFISEELGVQKPDPRFFSTMLSKTNLQQKKQECLMIGDSLSSDIQGGNASGIDTIYLNRDNKQPQSSCKPTHEIVNLTDLLDLLPPIH